MYYYYNITGNNLRLLIHLLKYQLNIFWVSTVYIVWLRFEYVFMLTI